MLCGLVLKGAGAPPENGQLWTQRDPALEAVQMSPVTSPRKAGTIPGIHTRVSGDGPEDGMIKRLPSHIDGKENHRPIWDWSEGTSYTER